MKTRWFCLATAGILAAASGLFAQGTAFTYQGRLNDGANPANGLYDFTFTLFGVESGGSALAGPITKSSTSVTNGLFTVTLEFGNEFPGDQRFLEIGVRTNGGGAFTTLSPRQTLTATPYAVRALTAANAAAVAAENIIGTIPPAQLPSSVLTNGATGVNLDGTFSGNGSALSNLNATSLTGPLSVTPIASAGHTNDGGFALDVAVSGNFAYLANADDGLRIYDITNPASPVSIGQIYDGGNALRVAVSGNFAYLANDRDGLRIYNIADPASPVSIGHIDDGGSANDVAVSGNFAYLANFDDGLRIYNIIDPASPVSVGHINDGGNAVGVAVSGSFAYLANGGDGLRIYDIANPASPVSIGHTNDGFAYGVAVSGHFAYVANHIAGLRIYNIANPASPVSVGSIYNGGLAHDVAVSGNFAYVANADDGLRIYNIANPASPVSIGHIGGGPWVAYGVAVSGHFAYVANYNDGLRIYDIGVASAPAFQGDGSLLTHLDASNITGTILPAQLPSSVVTNGPTGVNLDGTFTGNGSALTNLNSASLTGPLSVTPITSTGHIYDDGNAFDVVVSGNFAYLANYNDGLRIYNIANPASPVSIGHIDDGGLAQGVVVSGNFAYLANGDDGLRIYNIANPASPVSVGSIDDGGNALGVAVSGNFAYLANGDDGLRIYNIANPASPVNVGHIDDGGNAQGVAVAGNFAYLANEGDGLRIYNIANPANPVGVGHINVGGYAIGVAVSGNFAYLANGGDGLRIFNITDPASPVSLGHVNDGIAGAVAVSGNFVYLANTYDGLSIYNIANPATPVRIGHIDDGFAYGVAVSGNFAYVANDDDGLRIYDIGVASAPAFQGDGSLLTHLDASKITSGTMADSQLSTNVALRSTTNTFAGDQTINGRLNVNSPGFDTATAIMRARPGDNIPFAAQDISGNNMLLVFTNGQVNISGDLYAGGVLNGSGAGLSSLNASQLTSGTVPNARLSANVSLLGPTIESSEITDGTILNADINAAAAIADTKLATISTAGKVANSALNSSVSLLGQTIESAEITDGTIVNSDINAAAAIADTKLATISTAGKVADTALSTNVARRAGGNTFTNDQFINGALNVNSPGSSTATAIVRARPSDNIPFAVQDLNGNNLLLVQTNATGQVNIGGDLRLHAWEGNGSNGTAFVQARDSSGTSSIGLVLRSQTNGVTGDAVSITGGGYVGIGTGAPSTKLQVNGTVTATEVKVAGGNFYSSAADAPLRIIRGRVAADGTIISGGGYTVNHSALGTYDITFNTPFTDTPALVVTGGIASYATSVGVGSVQVVLAGAAGIPGDFNLSFIAIGGR